MKTSSSPVRCRCEIVWKEGEWLGYICPPTAGRMCVIVNEDKLKVLEFLVDTAMAEGFDGDGIQIDELAAADPGYWDALADVH